jgi:hypothetical protein
MIASAAISYWKGCPEALVHGARRLGFDSGGALAEVGQELQDASLVLCPLSVSAEGGRLTLDGTVRTPAERKLGTPRAFRRTTRYS